MDAKKVATLKAVASAAIFFTVIAIVGMAGLMGLAFFHAIPQTMLALDVGGAAGAALGLAFAGASMKHIWRR
jgi:hypothetical protein